MTVAGREDAPRIDTDTRSRRIPERLAWLVTDILTGVIDRGTGTAADIGRPAAGKTGTTQANADAWFVGYVPQLAASVWVGYPDSMRPMNDVHGGTGLGRLAARAHLEAVHDGGARRSRR